MGFEQRRLYCKRKVIDDEIEGTFHIVFEFAYHVAVMTMRTHHTNFIRWSLMYQLRASRSLQRSTSIVKSDMLASMASQCLFKCVRRGSCFACYWNYRNKSMLVFPFAYFFCMTGSVSEERLHHHGGAVWNARRSAWELGVRIMLGTDVTWKWWAHTTWRHESWFTL